MDYIPVPETVMMELVYAWDSQIVETVLHYHSTVVWTPTKQSALAASAAAVWNTSFKAAMPSSISLINIKVTDIRTQFGPVIDYGVGLPNPGTNVSPSLPNSNTLVITKRTGLRGRSFRGRIYHPGLMEASVTNNAVLPANVTAYIGMYNSLISLGIGGSDVANMVVVSRRFEGAWRITGVYTYVTNLTSDGMIDSQRRRLPGRGA